MELIEFKMTPEMREFLSNIAIIAQSLKDLSNCTSKGHLSFDITNGDR